MSGPGSVVFVVDDEDSVLRATARLLRAAGLVVRTFSSGTSLLSELDVETPGCVVADLQMPGLNGLELQQALTAAGCSLPIVFLSGHGDVSSSVRAMRGGAEDFIQKTAPADELLAAVRRAIERDAVGRATAMDRQRLGARLDLLTPREREVLLHVVRGRLNKQIAADLGIHERTVKLHRTAITTKLGVHSVAELTSFCHDAGLLDPASRPFPKG